MVATVLELRLTQKLARSGKSTLIVGRLSLVPRCSEALYTTEFQRLTRSSAWLEGKLPVKCGNQGALRDLSARKKRRFHPDVTRPRGGVANGVHKVLDRFSGGPRASCCRRSGQKTAPRQSGGAPPSKRRERDAREAQRPRFHPPGAAPQGRGHAG